MKLYKVTIGNYLDSSVRSELILSEQPLSMGQHTLNSAAGIREYAWEDEEWQEFVVSVEIAHIRLNPFIVEEHIEMTDLLKKLGQ
jgi:hypothetical protein